MCAKRMAGTFKIKENFFMFSTLEQVSNVIMSLIQTSFNTSIIALLSFLFIVKDL